ncbi:MAG TPA: thioredoxin family protein [Bacteroidia bacterium]|nr:thioredoxin family protein [Bacteroidia bacterium]
MLKTYRFLTTLLILVLLGGFTFRFGHGLDVGDKAKDFRLLSASGKTVSLSTMSDVKGAIIIFTCNHCPFSQAYEDRIIALHKKYAPEGYPVIAINPNDASKVPDDSYENMQKRAQEKSFPFEYLYDESQETAKAYGASRTPHVFLLTKKNNKFYVAYIGGIDNNTDEPENVTKKYVEEAVDELIAGKPVTTSFTKAIGCSIKWKQN